MKQAWRFFLGGVIGVLIINWSIPDPPGHSAALGYASAAMMVVCTLILIYCKVQLIRNKEKAKL